MFTPTQRAQVRGVSNISLQVRCQQNLLQFLISRFSSREILNFTADFYKTEIKLGIKYAEILNFTADFYNTKVKLCILYNTVVNMQ